jgi:hypothetical protein
MTDVQEILARLVDATDRKTEAQADIDQCHRELVSAARAGGFTVSLRVECSMCGARLDDRNRASLGRCVGCAIADRTKRENEGDRPTRSKS